MLGELQAIAGSRLSNFCQVGHVLHSNAAIATDHRAVFVGVEAYEAGGGKITCDLISEDLFFEDKQTLDDAFATPLAKLQRRCGSPMAGRGPLPTSRPTSAGTTSRTASSHVFIDASKFPMDAEGGGA